MESLIDIEDFPGRSDRHDNRDHPDCHDHYDDGDHIHDDAAAVMTMTRLAMIIAMTLKTSMELFVITNADDGHDIGNESELLLNSLLNFNVPMA